MGTRLYVGNLSFKTNEEGIRTAFGQFGTVADVQIMIDRETGQSRGFAFVAMADETSAREAQKQMHGAVLDGRPLKVDEAEERGARKGGPGGGGGGGKRRW